MKKFLVIMLALGFPSAVFAQGMMQHETTTKYRYQKSNKKMMKRNHQMKDYNMQKRNEHKEYMQKRRMDRKHHNQEWHMNRMLDSEENQYSN